MISLKIFKEKGFIPALKVFFKELQVPVNYIADQPIAPMEILRKSYKDNETFKLIDDTFLFGIVDDASFEGNRSFDVENIKSDYDGILIFGITLNPRHKGLLPTRSQLAEISRAFNREFYYTPVVVIFRYGNYVAFANVERLKYKQEWREGEKTGKVSLLRDIDIEKPHSGHERILAELQIPSTGAKKVDSFEKLYAYWQEVFSVSLLNKKFYQELSNWYFWATQHVIFPGEPTISDAHHKKAKHEVLLQEHRATNVIRMLTRLLFVWFIKEKKLIPEELFDLDALQKDILNEISPYHERGMFRERNKESIYYKAILQNLFFATLNCPIKADSLDKRRRGFRGEGYGTHRGIDYLMRYKSYFKNPDAFLKKLNEVVPFLNGGLFECLDDKFNNIYIDGFSDQMTKGEKLVVPDYLFFGVEEETDLSDIVGIKDRKYKQAAVKGLVNILKSYKFTITENTPIEEDVALDPELLGKVFENLLASYNPETKTTARKQTGSFYTPREIVNYMVDESLIAYLKNKILDEKSVYVEFGKNQTNIFGNRGKVGQQSFQTDISASELKEDEEELDKLLHQLVSFNPGNPFKDQPKTTRLILNHLSKCTILDPACGSGAFPMGILQKMVHILQKLDPDNKIWKEVQLTKARKESEAAFEIEDKQAREERLLEINEAFDQSLNDSDYARKLFLIENCIYGIDILPIATQISKLRFFISLVVEQKVNADKDNFGIRPLPNLETKFVAANTLIGIEKPHGQLSLYDSKEVKGLEKELKSVRHKLFSAKTKETKLKYRVRDEELRNTIAKKLEKSGWNSDTAQMLATWDPYNQNASSTFFDPEWMFDINDGFDVVIGNPPYGASFSNEEKKYFKDFYIHQNYQAESFLLFIEKAFQILGQNGVLSYIIPNTWLTNLKLINIRKLIFGHSAILNISHYNHSVFDAVVDTEVLILKKGFLKSHKFCVRLVQREEVKTIIQNQDYFRGKNGNTVNVFFNSEQLKVIEQIEKYNPIDRLCSLFSGLKPYEVGKGNPSQTKEMVKNRVYDSKYKIDDSYRPLLRGSDFEKYLNKWDGSRWIKYGNNLAAPRDKKIFDSQKIVIRQTGDSIIGIIDNDKFVCQNNTHVIIAKSNADLRYILGILNSKLATFYFRYLNPEAGEALAEVKKETVAKIPVPNYSNNFLAIAILVDLIILKPNAIILKDTIDALVFNLYFPDHMKERGINVFEFVEQDTHQVLQGKDFEKLNNLEKEQIIEALHAKWGHPDNEVRNRIKLFAVRSPEILKPILES